MRRVARHAKRLALQKVWSQPRAAVGHGALRGFVNRQHVVTVHNGGGHVISRAAVGHVGACHLEVERRGIGIAVVIADEHHRQFLHRRQVHAFVPVPAAGGAVAEIAEGHAVPVQIFER